MGGKAALLVGPRVLFELYGSSTGSSVTNELQICQYYELNIAHAELHLTASQRLRPFFVQHYLVTAESWIVRHLINKDYTVAVERRPAG